MNVWPLWILCVAIACVGCDSHREVDASMEDLRYIKSKWIAAGRPTDVNVKTVWSSPNRYVFPANALGTNLFIMNIYHEDNDYLCSIVADRLKTVRVVGQPHINSLSAAKRPFPRTEIHTEPNFEML